MKTKLLSVLSLSALLSASALAGPIARDLGSIIGDFPGVIVPAGTGAGLLGTGAEYVEPIDLLVDPDSDIILAFELAGNAGSNEFGFYLERPDETVASMLKVFDGSATGAPGFPSTATMTWDFGTGIATSSTFGASDFSQVLKNALAGWNIGVYLSGPGGTFYSNDSLNGGRQVEMFDISGIGSLLGDVAFAWEDLPIATSDRDYNDMLVLASDLRVRHAQVPAPGGAVVFLAGLGAILWNRRKSKA